jgi:Domain of unknown function (DUF4111)
MSTDVVEPVVAQYAEVAVAEAAESVPNPARGLELVVYALGARPHEFELNFNTWTRGRRSLDLDPAEEPAHWYVLDAAQAEQHAYALAGPGWTEVFEHVSPAEVTRALTDGLDRAEQNELAEPFTVLNSCRAWRYAETAEWSTKADAAEWARERFADPALIDDALAGQRLEPARVRALLDRVREQLA